MDESHKFPEHVTVRVTPLPKPGLAISIYFDMKFKKKFGYTVFTDKCGLAKVDKLELLTDFDNTRFFFLMDYVDPRENFTGRVTAKVLDSSGLKRASDALKTYRDYLRFPVNYEKNLLAATNTIQEYNDFEVTVILEY